MNQGVLPKSCHLWLISTFFFFLISTFEITLPTKAFQIFIEDLFYKAQTGFGFTDCQFWKESYWFFA